MPDDASLKSTTVRTSLALRLLGFALRVLDRVVPAFAERLAAGIFLSPRRPGRPPREREWLARAERTDHTIGGRRIATWSWGSGEPVLLIHGWEGRGSQMAAFADSAHGSRYRWIAVDLPAHGDSPGRHTNLLEIAEVIRGLIDELRPAAIVAHSFGSAGTSVALTAGPFEGKLVYIAPPEDFNYFTSLFGAMLGISPDLAKRMQRRIEQLLDVDWAKLRGTALAPEMEAPLLIVHDEDDFDVPHRFGRAIAESWPGASLLTTKGLGHRRILRDEKVIEAAVDFIASPENRQATRSA